MEINNLRQEKGMKRTTTIVAALLFGVAGNAARGQRSSWLSHKLRDCSPLHIVLAMS
jgi:hypothetical protein